MTVYICEICRQANHVARLTCQSCGTTPRQYSITGKASKMIDDEFGPRLINVVTAYGAIRQEDIRSRRLYFRTERG